MVTSAQYHFLSMLCDYFIPLPRSPTPLPSASPSATPSTSAPTAVPPQCGSQANFVACPLPMFCCSADGYCGLGDRYCGVGCQSGPFCADPKPANFVTEQDHEKEQDEEQEESAEENSDRYNFGPIGVGVDSIHGNMCGSMVTYLKNMVPRTRNCDSPNFNPANLCNRNLANTDGKVSDVCCERCAEYVRR